MSGAAPAGHKRIKVLYVFATLQVGGAEELLVSEVEGLDHRTFDPLVCVISEKGPIGEQIERMGVRVIPLHRMKSSRFDPRIIGDLRALIKKERAAVVHTHLYDGNKYGRLGAWLARVPCLVSTYHSVYVRRRLKYHLINWALSALNDRIIAVSGAVKESVVRYDKIPAGKIQVLYNGIDPAIFQGLGDRAEVRRRFAINDDDFLIGVIARLEEPKGHTFLLQALSRVIRDCRKLKVLVVGDGKLRVPLEEQSRALGLSDFVQFTGTQKPIAPILGALDLFLLPSLREGFSIAILEAMAAGLPVVATSVGGTAEVITSGLDGVLIPPGDIGSLTAAIRHALLHADEYRDMGRRGRDKILEKFTKSRHMSLLEALYLEVLTEKGIGLNEGREESDHDRP